MTEIVNYKKYGRCLRVANDKIEVYFTLDVGPRIIKFNCQGYDNMLFNDNELETFHDVSSVFGEGERWYIYGGHRMWVSPETMPETYYPDNSPVEYSVTEKDGCTEVTLCPEVQKVNKLQHRIVATVYDSGKMTVDHYLTNKNEFAVKKGIWGITVTDTNGIAVMRQPEIIHEYLPNRKIVYWPHTTMGDDRFLLGHKYVTVLQDHSEGRIQGKIGYTNFDGQIFCFNHDQAFCIEHNSDYENGEYADYNVSSEIYVNKDILELESLGYFSTIEPEQTVSHRETWSVVPFADKPEFNEDSVDRSMKKLEAMNFPS